MSNECPYSGTCPHYRETDKVCQNQEGNLPLITIFGRGVLYLKRSPCKIAIKDKLRGRESFLTQVFSLDD